MRGNLPNAEPSPRIHNGVVCWCEGDTFVWDIIFLLKDQDCTTKNILPTETVKVVFLDKRMNQIKEFNFSNIVRNTISLEFDADCTALFEKGSYTYDIYLNGTKRTTLANDNKVVVE